MEITRIDAIITDIVGKIGNTIYTSKRGKTYIARGRYMEGTPTRDQKEWRAKYTEVDMLWADLDEDEKNSWKRLKTGKGQSRYSKFMHVNLKRIRQGKTLLRKYPY